MLELCQGDCKLRSTLRSATTLKPVEEQWAGSPTVAGPLRVPKVVARSEPMPGAAKGQAKSTRCRFPVRNAPTLAAAPPIDDCQPFETRLVGSLLLSMFLRPSDTPDFERTGEIPDGVQRRFAAIDLAAPAPAWTQLGAFTTGPGTERGILDACLLPGRVVTLTGEADDAAGSDNGRDTFRLTATSVGAAPVTSWQLATPELGPQVDSLEDTGNGRRAVGRLVSIACTSSEVFALTSIPGKGEDEIEQVLRYTPTP